MSENTIRRRMLLGAGFGALALTVPRAQADTPFSSFAFLTEGTAAARTMPARLAEIKNVKDYGAVGDGTTNDTAAIQAAVNRVTAPYSSANRGIVYFPTGTYRLTGPITWEAEDIHIQFLGAPGATLIGQFGDALLKRTNEQTTAGVHVIENLRFINGHTDGSGVILRGCVGARVANCWFGGANTGKNALQFEAQGGTIDACTMIGWAGCGIIIGNGCSVIDCDVSGCGEGIRHHNLGLNVLGGRYEMNRVGIMLGKSPTGQVWQSSGVSISGMSMESNGTGIYMLAGSGVSIQGCAVTVNITGASNGIYVHNGIGIAISGVTVSNAHSFSGAGINLNNASQTLISATKIAVGGGNVWRLPSDTSKYTLIQCDPTP